MDQVSMKKKNPIDKEKIAENPHLLPYAHHLGSAIIRPIDKGKTKGLAMSAMYQQTEGSLLQIKQQIETLVQQAQSIHNRINISEKIYEADCGFKPNVGQTYHLYQKEDESFTLSIIGPEEWGKNKPFNFVASAELLADHTWKILVEGTTFTSFEDQQK